MDPPKLAREKTMLTAVTSTTEETRAIMDKHAADNKSDIIPHEPVSTADLEKAQKLSKEHSGGVKAQFYPEIEPRLRSMTLSDIHAADERFGKRPEEEEAAKIRVSVTSKDAPGMFSTAVDEDVIQAAKERQRKALGGVRLDDTETDKPVFMTGKEVVTKRAKEHYQLGLEFMEKKDFTAAIIKFNKAINLRADVIDFYSQRGECYLMICDFQSAILNLKRACCLDPENTELYQHLAFVYYFQGQSLFDERRYEEALDAFNRAAEMCPEECGYQTRIIACLAALQRHGECLSLINKRLDFDKNNADLYVMRARLHELFRNKLEIYESVIDHSLVNLNEKRPYIVPCVTLCAYDVRDAVTLDPEHPEALRLQRKLRNKSLENRKAAMQLSALGKSKEALQKISIAIEMEPGDAQYHVLRGALHRRLGDFNSAIDDYLLALDKTDHTETNETYQDAQRQLLLTYNDFAVECFTKGFYEEAVILLNKAVKGEKTEKGLYINRGDCFFKQGDLNFALADYEQANEMDSQDQSIRTRLSVVHHEFGVLDYQDKQYLDSEKRFTAAISHNQNVGRYYISRSRARYMLEDHESARFDILTALLLDPTNEELISITSRLFPGKSIRDVLESPQAEDARRLLQQHAPSRMSKVSTLTDGKSMKSGDRASPPPRVRKASPLWKREPLMPGVTRCMREWEFNLTVLEEKKSIKCSIKHALHERQSLRYTGGRICTMPPNDELRKHTKRPLVKMVKF